ncbi:kinase-like domain-containing protein [Sporodiniella umbellata]|nr:kinase-like domain-containing protein [Sporodiniella umbellata]
MSQQLPNPLSFLKSANHSSVSLESSTERSRSASLLRAMSVPSVSSRKNSTSPSFRSYHEDEEETMHCHRQFFELQYPIGYGSSAVVYRAIYRPKHLVVAIKVIELELFERNQIDELRRETALMALSKHPNILKVYGSFIDGSKLHIVTPYLSGGSCLDSMRNGFLHGLEETVIATVLKQALKGLIYLHKNGHMHRDVKAGNLLMDDQGTVLLSDFGVSSSLIDNNEIRKTFVGTPCWMAPEVMEQSGYNLKADIWSFGITAIELATGHAPFAKFPPMKVLMMTLSQSPPTLNREQTKYKYSRIFKEMIDLCLQKDARKRPTAEKLLLHPFFKQAKKRDYLVKSLLQCIPPLERRCHRKSLPRACSGTSCEQWDFDEDTCSSRHVSFGGAIIRSLPSPAHSEPETQPSVDEENTGTFSASPPNEPTPVGLGITDIEGNEIKRGRFSVNQCRPGPLDTSCSEPCPLSISRTNSSNKARKSRLSTLPELSPPSTIHDTYTSESLKLEPFHQRSASSGSCRIGRFSISEHEEIPLECRKRGRFELTSPLLTLPTPHGQIQMLLKQLEAQKSILNHITHCLIDSSPTSSTIDYLQQRLIHSHQEKERLFRENQALREEIHALKESKCI